MPCLWGCSRCPHSSSQFWFSLFCHQQTQSKQWEATVVMMGPKRIEQEHQTCQPHTPTTIHPQNMLPQLLSTMCHRTCHLAEAWWLDAAGDTKRQQHMHHNGTEWWTGATKATLTAKIESFEIVEQLLMEKTAALEAMQRQIEGNNCGVSQKKWCGTTVLQDVIGQVCFHAERVCFHVGDWWKVFFMSQNSSLEQISFGIWIWTSQQTQTETLTFSVKNQQLSNAKPMEK